MSTVGIIGAGIAGLQLGLFLRHNDITATIYTSQSPAQLLSGRLRNVVVRSAPTRERERRLAVNHWDAVRDLSCISVDVRGERPLSFSGRFDQPTLAVDMRIYCARLLEDFAARGGQVVTGALEAGDVQRLSAQHELIVAATGRGRLANMFPRLPEHCPFREPQRLVVAGLYRGVADARPLSFEVTVIPGHGEIFVVPLVTFEPGVTAIAVEIRPGGAFEALGRLRCQPDPSPIEAALLGLLRKHAPTVYGRVDASAFRLTRPNDFCHTAITPTVRRGYVRLPNGRYALALGDMHVLIDPITGQGANTASRAAWVVGEAIRAGGSFDEAFCRRVEQRIWSFAQAVSEACDARLRPPEPHWIEFIAAASEDQALADMYASGFNHPDRFWELLSSPERTRAVLQRHGHRAEPVAAAPV